MPAIGSSDIVVARDVMEMERTHVLAAEIGAPDLKEPSLFGDTASGKESESSLTRSAACARVLTRRALAAESLRRRPVDGFFVRCGHVKDEANTYTDAKGDRCRSCRNANRRDALKARERALAFLAA